MSAEAEKALAEIMEVSDGCADLLAGRDPAIQGAVLVQLVGTYLSGYQDKAHREAMLELHVATVKDYIEDSPSSGDHTGGSRPRKDN